MSVTTIISLAGLLLGSQWLGTLVVRIYDNRRKDKVDSPIEKLSKQLEGMAKQISALQILLDQNSEVTMSHARDRLNHLCKQYQSQGYIPEQDYVAFKLLGEAYIHAHGNHGFEIKFKHVIETLPVKGE